jgi:hypothetical protein
MGLAPLERPAMKRLWIFALAALLAATTAARADPATADVCVVVGAPGGDTYSPGFAAAAKKWQDNCRQAGATCTVIGLDDQKDADPAKNSLDRDKLRDWIAALDPKLTTPVWIIYLGHGTFDGKDARLNLRGVQISAVELAALLKPVKRTLVFVDGASASAPFINALSAPNRIIITATQTGREVDYARFGEQFATAIADPSADLDQDGQVSVLEAFVTAAQRAQDFYAENDRMATEHALIDDNGDKRGTPASWFQGTRLVRKPQGNVAPDGDFAKNLALITSAAERAMTDDDRRLRDQYEKQLDQLRGQKDNLDEDDYYAQLEVILRKLAAIYVKTPPPAAAPVPAAAPALTPDLAPASPTTPAPAADAVKQ